MHIHRHPSRAAFRARAVVITVAFALWSASVSAAEPSRADRDATDAARIVAAVPAALGAEGSITSITVTPRRDGRDGPRTVLSDPDAVARITATLRRIVLEGRFRIGHQFHAPSQTHEIVFFRGRAAALRVLSVGESMFWIFPGPHSADAAPVNLQSAEFDDVIREFLPTAAAGTRSARF